tara:strand:- start:400 stop:519 length:120 start_codon:yes stop_codon:yes gene_type:complete
MLRLYRAFFGLLSSNAKYQPVLIKIFMLFLGLTFGETIL